MPALIALAVLIGAPVIEIAVFIRVGGAIGVWPTIALTLLTAIVGAAIARAQGVEVLLRARARADRGEAPVAEMLDGALLLFAGLLLLIPGFVTDALGFALLIAPLRRALVGGVAGPMIARAAARGGGFAGGGSAGGRPGARAGDTVEGEWVEVGPDPAGAPGGGRGGGGRSGGSGGGPSDGDGATPWRPPARRE